MLLTLQGLAFSWYYWNCRCFFCMSGSGIFLINIFDVFKSQKAAWWLLNIFRPDFKVSLITLLAEIARHVISEEVVKGRFLCCVALHKWVGSHNYVFSSDLILNHRCFIHVFFCVIRLQFFDFVYWCIRLTFFLFLRNAFLAQVSDKKNAC